MMYDNAARQIKLLRLKHNLTQSKLAKELGVDDKYISVIERKVRKGSLYFYKNVANYFQVSLDYLFMDSIQAKKNIYIDTVTLRMSYMGEKEQEMIMKFVENFGEYIKNNE